MRRFFSSPSTNTTASYVTAAVDVVIFASSLLMLLCHFNTMDKTWPT